MSRDPSMLELFRQEVESQAECLTDGLLALEKGGSSREVEGLMRAAHSIKGAARIVGLDPAVRLAHAMEDRFLSAGVSRVDSETIDVLLRAVDLFLRLAGVEEDGMDGWLEANAGEFDALVARLDPAAPAPAPDPASPEQSTPAPPSPYEPATGFRTRRIMRQETRSVIEQFEAEIENHSAVLQERLPALTGTRGSSADVEACRHAARELRGAAFLAGRPLAGRIAEAIGEGLDVGATGRRVLDASAIELILEGVDLIRSSTGQPPTTWSERNAAAVERFVAGIDALVASRASEERPVEPVQMLEVFQGEVENQALVLDRGLHDLRHDPSATDRIDVLLMAANAIQGAAKMIGIPEAARLAEAIESILGAIQDGRRHLEGSHLPVLIEGVEVLRRTAAEYRTGAGALSSADTQRILQATVEIETLSSEADPTPKPAPTERPGSRRPARPGEIRTNLPATRDGNGDRFVRITAENLDRLMGLAGEALVQVNWLQPFADSLLAIKRSQAALSTRLESARQELIDADGATSPASLALKQAITEHARGREMLSDRLVELEDYARRSVNLSDRLYREVIASRMRPFADGVKAFPRLVRDLARSLGRRIAFEVLGPRTEVDRDILERLEAPLNHLIRNSIDHGCEDPADRLAAGKPESATLRVEAAHRAGMLSIRVVDDGRGIDLGALRDRIVERRLADRETVEILSEAELLDYLFRTGFSTASQVTEISGRGVGLDVVRTMVQDVGGTVRVSTAAGRGTTFELELPLTLSVLRTLLVEIAGEPYAFPLTRIDQVLRVDVQSLGVLQDRQYFTWNDSNIGLVSATQVLDFDPLVEDRQELPVIVLSHGSSRYGIIVDAILGERDLVVRPLDRRLGKVKNISAGALMEDGSLVLILDVVDLISSMDSLLDESRPTKVRRTRARVRAKRVLVIDDSITVRELERRVLEGGGFHVDVAVDGIDGWNTVRTGAYDLVITDIDMPRMNGIELLRRIRNEPSLRNLPVMIVSYKDREEDRRAGLEAGADFFLTKKHFDDESLLEAVGDLVGDATG